jgi:hypothetical protein
MKDYAFLIAAALVPIGMLLYVKFWSSLEEMAFKHLPNGRLRTLLITDWSTGKTPETLEELREQRGL